MTVEMKMLLALIIVTSVVSFSFALKMAWENLSAGSAKKTAHPREEACRFGSGPAFTSSR